MHHKEIILSIIIPCFNSEKTLRDAVSSCFTQHLSIPFEIILVDDASTDGTRVLIDELQSEYSEIVSAYHEKNKGGGATRNTAAKLASGSLLFCLDSDDLLPEGTLNKMVDYLQKKKADGVGVHRSIKFRGNDTNNIILVHEFGYAEEKIPFVSLLQRDNIYCPLYSTFLITKSAFKAIGGYPDHHGFDTQGIAWRFLAAGFTAYTCPNTSYLHRIEFGKSYYLREADEGKVNYNWQDIFLEHLPFFEEGTQKFITSFDCKNFSKNLFDELLKRDAIFKPNYQELIGTISRQPHTSRKRIYIKRNSPRGIYLRIKEKVKKNSVMRPVAIYLNELFKRTKRLLNEKNEKKKYYQHIETIKHQKKIVFDLAFGGIGDCLAASTLPRLLKEKYDIDFYLSAKSRTLIRHPDTFILCFKMNPYYKGVSDAKDVFKLQFFESEKSLYTFITDKEGQTVLETLEKQFGVQSEGKPEIYYKPKMLETYRNVILIDENTISGKRFGWKFRKDAFYNEALKYKTESDTIEYADPKKQDFFTYVDMIYSCKRFVATFSGGASIAAAFEKPFSVLWPLNGVNGSNFQFRYKQSKATYVK